eukprot:COSAG02_NODE_2460_length_8797_cov_6.129915_2_plen_91_part_00
MGHDTIATTKQRRHLQEFGRNTKIVTRERADGRRISDYNNVFGPDGKLLRPLRASHDGGSEFKPAQRQHDVNLLMYSCTPVPQIDTSRHT